jgi:hypothetical protein
MVRWCPWAKAGKSCGEGERKKWGKRRGPKNSTNFALRYLPAKYPYATALLTLLLPPACLQPAMAIGGLEQHKRWQGGNERAAPFFSAYYQNLLLPSSSSSASRCHVGICLGLFFFPRCVWRELKRVAFLEELACHSLFTRALQKK